MVVVVDGEEVVGRRSWWNCCSLSPFLSPFSYVAWSFSLSIPPTGTPVHAISPTLAISPSPPALYKAVRLPRYFSSSIYSRLSSRQGQARGRTQVSRSQDSHRSRPLLRVSIGSCQRHRHQCHRRPNARPLGEIPHLCLCRGP